MAIHYHNNMLSGIRIYTSDIVWRQILGDLGACVLDAPSVMDINFDDLEISDVLSPMALKSLLLNASDNSAFISKIFGKNVILPRVQANILSCLYKTGGLTISQLKDALGYAPDASTHAVETAIYQLRRIYGREFIQIDQWFPSSKKCHVCGEINHDLGRGEREWECPHCHSILSRDVNAAKNILDEGLRATGSIVLCLVDFMPTVSSKHFHS